MDVAGGFLTGLFFDLARDALKELVKIAVERKLGKIGEVEVRQKLIEVLQALLEELKRQRPDQEIHIHIEVGTLDILVQEVYSIANASNGLEVKGKTIEIKRAPLIQIPETIREMQLSKRVHSIKSELEEVAHQDSISEQVHTQLQPPQQESPERPLMFEAPNTTPQSGAAPRDVGEIVSDYKRRIQSIITEEENE